MSRKALLDYAPNRATVWHEEDGKVYIETLQDCEPMIKAAKILAEVPPRKEDGWRFLGFVPQPVMDKAFNEGWFHDEKAWRRFFNDRDNRLLNGGRENVG